MQYRKLGKTGLQVSEIGFGGIPLQRVSPAEAAEVVREALALGINFFDSARGYTDSEAKIGQALQGYPRSEVILASKSGVLGKEEMLRDIEISLRNFGTDYLDLYQLHNLRDPENVARIFAPGGALEGLRQARQEGKIRFIGITGHLPALLLDLLKKEDFDTVQFPFNTVEQDALPELLPYALKHDIGTIVMTPLAGGALGRPAAALKYILRHDLSSAIPGMKSVAEVRENAAASGAVLGRSEEDELHREKEQLGASFCRRCDYCQPCPQGIDIPSLMTLQRYSERYELHEWALKRYRLQQAGPGDCLECGECEEKCPYNLPIRELLKACRQCFEG